MGLKIFSNNMDEPDLNNVVKNTDIDPLKATLEKISQKAEKYKNQQNNDLETEDEFAINTLERVHIFYMFAVIQIILAIILGVYQIISFRKVLTLQ